MVVLVEILGLRAVVEETVEKKKGCEEKETAEGGEEAEIERKVEEEAEKEEEEGSQGGDNDPRMDGDLLDPGWTASSG